jgi:monoamine oxidase
MQRRDFLRRAGLLTASLPHLTSFQESIEPLQKNEPVLILGAGLAGLSAAYALQKKNIPFIILEARNRFGGRVFTHIMDKNSGLHTELGAEWVGISHLKVIALCKELNLKLIDHTFRQAAVLQEKYYPVWEEETAWKAKRLQLFEKYKNATQKEFRQLDKMDWWRFLLENGIPERELEIRDLNDSTDFGESIRNVSAFSALAEYAESGENNEMDFKIEGGNSQLVRALAEKIGLDKILLSKKVRHIRQNSTNVIVTCEDNTSYSAGRLICTVPAFAASRMEWHPILPIEKMQALQQLQYARIAKTQVLFPERFWQNEKFNVTTDTLAHFIFHTTQNQPGSQGILTSYATGDKAQVMSRLPENRRIRELCQAIESAFPGTEKLARKAVSYYWGDDEFSKGAYANFDVGQWFGLRETLAKPFLKTLFAGEHLADWQGFMEGAVETGMAAGAAP